MQRRISARTEKALRLVITCLIAAVFGILAVARDSETLGYIGVGVLLVGILVGPLTSRVMTKERP
jgi:hypothetical protein